MYRRRSLTASLSVSLLVVLVAAFIGSVATVPSAPTLEGLVERATTSTTTFAASERTGSTARGRSTTPPSASDPASGTASHSPEAVGPAGLGPEGIEPGGIGPEAPVDRRSTVNLSASEIATRLGDAVYRVETVSCSGAAATGSAWVIDDRHLVTNRHVVADDPEPIMVSRRGERLNGTVIGWSEEPDIAVVRVEAGTFDTSLKWAATDTLTEGQRIVSLGYPVPGRDFSVTSGSIVSFQKRSGQREAIRADGALDRGNSGSPALTTEGLVAGVVTEIDENAEGLRPVPLIFTRDALASVVERMLTNPETVRADCEDGGDADDEERTKAVSLPPGVDTGACLVRESVAGERAEVLRTSECQVDHDAEIFHRFEAEESVDHPGVRALDETARSTCEQQFGDYVGLDFAFSVLDIDFRTPTVAEWSDGDRTVFCWLQRVDSEPLIRSARGAGI